MNRLEPPRRGGSNEYPQSIFWSKNKKNRYTPAYPSFAIRKGDSRGYTLHGHVFVTCGVKSMCPKYVTGPRVFATTEVSVIPNFLFLLGVIIALLAIAISVGVGLIVHFAENRTLECTFPGGRGKDGSVVQTQTGDKATSKYWFGVL